MNKLIHAIWVIGLVGCAQSSPDNNTEKINSGAEEMFATSRSQIDSLENSSKADWIKSSGSHEEIESLAELKQLIHSVSFTEAERSQLAVDFHQAHSTTHFGFDCDYHALVLFDSSGTPIRIEKW